MQHITTQARGWQPEHTLSVAEAIKEAMDDSPVRSRSRRHVRPSMDTPRDFPAPEPHLPLRRASANSRFQSRKGSVPKPILAPPNTHHPRVRGFNPSPVQPPAPHIDSITASSEHAFAGREPKRPFKSAVGTLENQTVLQHAEGNPLYNGRDGRPPSSPLLPPPPRSSRSPTAVQRGTSLRASRSVGDGLASVRRVSSKQPGSGRRTPDSFITRPSTTTASDEIRDSFRSALTSHSSLAHTSSITTTTYTSISERSSHSGSFVKVQRADYEESGLTDVDMSVEDAIGMYEDGFESGAGSARGSFDVRSVRSMDRNGKLTPEVRSVRSLHMERSVSQPPSQSRVPLQPSTPLRTQQRAYAAHRRSQSASILIVGIPKNARPGAVSSPGPSLQIPAAPSDKQRSSVQIATNQRPQSTGAVPRDRYGFKKASHHITVEQYDAWDANYSGHIDRRTRKWHALMQSYGLSTDQPLRFPPKSDKIKRYVRKGIPPGFRGAAWFWYAGGPGKMAKDPGLYWELLEKVENGMLSDTDREHIERDLNRTFPDNVRFKPDPSTTADAQADAGGGKEENLDPTTSPNSNRKRSRRQTQEIETPIVKSLRRVLQAFAIHNPNIGYCQSLNFIAGLLLIFLDEDEEKAFILLNIVTSQHLPGTHGIALEGANIDIAVLMSCVKDTLPGVWDKLDDKGPLSSGLVSGTGALRLPTVSLATTAWFMSLFVGTLPIESVLRVWDCLFFEGSKTLFRIALAIFKAGEQPILKVSDPMEIFQVVQTIPRGMLDVNALMEVCFRRRGGFGSVSQGLIEGRRAEMRRRVKEGITAAQMEDEGAFRKLRVRLRRGTVKI